MQLSAAVLVCLCALGCSVVGDGVPGKVTGGVTGGVRLPPTQYTRTALHVSRSLDPENTQLLHVKTRAGDVATLIVKKRVGKEHAANAANVTRDDIFRNIRLAESAAFQKQRERIVNDQNRKRAEDVTSSLHSPAVVRSTGQHVKTTLGAAVAVDSSPIANWNLRSRSAGVTSSSSVRSDSGTSQSTGTIRVPEPVYIRSMPMFVKGEREDELKRGRSMIKIGSDGIPVIQGVRMPDDESDKQVWRNARVINGVLVANEKQDQGVQVIVKKPIKKKITTSTTRLESVPLERRQDQDETNSFASSHIDRLVPLYRLPANGQTDSSILDFIKSVNQRELVRNGQAKARGRMIQYQYPAGSGRNSEPSSEQWPQPSEQSSSRVRFPTRRSDTDVQERSSDSDSQQAFQPSYVQAQAAFQPRMLHYGSPMYPSSQLYTPYSKTKKPARVAFEEGVGVGVRSPVLQYAHPELGVQPARLVAKSSKLVTEASDASNVNAATMAMFQQDLHSDRSPYVGMETDIESDPRSSETSSGSKSPSAPPSASPFYQTTSQESAHNKVFAYDNQNYEFPKKNYYQSRDSYGLSNDEYIKRYPNDGYNSVNSYNAYSGPYLVKVVERPFWEQITDTIRDHVQTGMDRVSDMTRPVVEPLIEATHKISKNLGFTQRSHANRQHQIQDKVGSVGVAASYPVLLPALGLMAGGAALGLGAVAVGRYLDVDMLQMRSQAGEPLSDAEHRALQAMLAVQGGDGGNGGEWIPVDTETRDMQGRSFALENDDGNDSTGNWETMSQEQSKNLKNIHPSNANEGKIYEKMSENLTEEKPQITRLGRVEAVAREVKDTQEVPSPSSQRKRREAERDILADILQSIETSSSSGLEHLEKHSGWSSQPCSKKLFCETMVQQPDDSILLMDKKMATFLNLIKPNAEVSHHLEQVMEAVKRHDCSQFTCTDD